MSWLGVWIALALVAFIAGCLARAIRYATMPLHLRWELYPVAHEAGKAAHGGSYFEDPDWWTRPRQVSRLGEARVIAEEVLTLKLLREHNRPLWLPSLAFHWGLYLLFALGAVLLGVAAAERLGVVPLTALGGGRFLSLWGGVALALATLGCAGLLARRLADARLRASSLPADFLHLWAFLALFLASWGSWVAVDRTYGQALRLLATGASPAAGQPLFVVQLVLLGAFLAYMPWSHMAHAFTKYFTWHSVRWDDRPNRAGTRFDPEVERLLALPVSWSAPHIRAGGGKTWRDVTSEPERGAQRRGDG